MRLHESVHIGRRFLRSIRIDTDLSNPQALEEFVCPQSFIDVFENMARHITETGQGAFTWTGPYGSGKSSLALAFSSCLSIDPDMRSAAAKVFNPTLVNQIFQALPPKNKGWRVLPIVGWRGDPILSVGECLKKQGMVSKKPRGGWTEKNLVEQLLTIATSDNEEYGGLLVIIDEMGKFLEAATQSSNDIYFFQELAETASRSSGRLLVVGILHQAFQEYANKLSRNLRDEWSKIQGRFVDLPVNVSADEQLDLVSRAVQTKDPPTELSEASKLVAESVYRDNKDLTDNLARTLSNCWPLHPVVAYLLGAISRRRFSQNQRSVFGFLNSAEPFGFRDFLKRGSDGEIYTPVHLWDYLRANLEPSILASPDGHRWALAAEALERCEYTGGDKIHSQLLKTIALIDLFKERSGLRPTTDLLRECLPCFGEPELHDATDLLQQWSLVIYRKYVHAFAIFAGSDFDIDEAILRELADIHELDCSKLESIVEVQPIVAKRHYHATGSLRWFDVKLVPSADLVTHLKKDDINNGAIGQFVLVIPTNNESELQITELCGGVLEKSTIQDRVLGYSPRNWELISYVKELEAVKNVKNNYAELAGDSVARREVNARLALLQTQVENRIQRALDSATWFQKNEVPKRHRFSELTTLASKLASAKFHKSPVLLNELLNRQKPSGSAIGARNVLLRRMVLNCGQQRLGIEGYPAEGGLFTSILQSTGLYSCKDNAWRFVCPKNADTHKLKPMWDEAMKFLKTRSSQPIALSDIYRVWMEPPFGVKIGILPVLGVAFIQSHKKNLAIYREGIFCPQFDDVDVDYLARDPSSIQIQWMLLSDRQRNILSSIADITRSLDKQNKLVHLEPLDVARGLVRIFDNLPNYTKRTTRMSSKTVRLRELFKRSQDPNKLIFEDLPRVLTDVDDNFSETDLNQFKDTLHSGLQELVRTYSTMLSKLRDTMLTELQVPNDMPQSLEELRNRAKNIKQLSGDFRVEAFVGRVANFNGCEVAFEGIASLVANKPPRDWVDLDFDRALVEIAEMSRSFLKSETFARVKNRKETRQAVAVMFGTRQSLTPISEEFYVRDTDQESIETIIRHIEALLNDLDENRREVVLAALAGLSTKYIKEECGTARELSDENS